MHFHLHPRFTLLPYHHPSSFELVLEALHLYLSLLLLLLLCFLRGSASVIDRSNTFCFECDANARGFELPAKSPHFLKNETTRRHLKHVFSKERQRER